MNFDVRLSIPCGTWLPLTMHVVRMDKKRKEILFRWPPALSWWNPTLFEETVTVCWVLEIYDLEVAAVNSHTCTHFLKIHTIMTINSDIQLSIHWDTLWLLTPLVLWISKNHKEIPFRRAPTLSWWNLTVFKEAVTICRVLEIYVVKLAAARSHNWTHFQKIHKIMLMNFEVHMSVHCDTSAPVTMYVMWISKNHEENLLRWHPTLCWWNLTLFEETVTVCGFLQIYGDEILGCEEP